MSMFPPDPGRRPSSRPLETWRDGPRLWSDWMQAELFERRTVMISGPIDDDVVGGLAAQLMTLDAAGDDPIHLHIDSTGGTLEATGALVDVMDLLGVPVHAHCVGRAEGPALVVLAVSDRRVASPHASLRLHEPPGEFQGRARDLEQWTEQRRRQLDQIRDRLAAATGQPADVLAADLERGRYLTPREAVERGFVDEIATPPAQVHHLRRHVGFRPQ